MKLFDVAFVPFPDEAHGIINCATTVNQDHTMFRILIDNRNSAEVQRQSLRKAYGQIMVGDLAEDAANAYAEIMPETMFLSFLSLSSIVHYNTLPEVVSA